MNSQWAWLRLTSEATNRALKSASLVTSPPTGVRSIMVSVYVCLSVFLSVRSHSSKTTRPIFIKFSVHVTCGRGSVFL